MTMKLYTILATISAAWSVSAAAIPHTKVTCEEATLATSGNVATITNQINLINTALFTLTYAAGNLTGKNDLSSTSSSGQAQALLSDFATLYNTTAHANDVIAPTPQLGLLDSLAVSGPLTAFGNNVNHTIAAVVRAKPRVVEAGIGKEVYGAMVRERDISVVFQNTLIDHLPTSIQGLAKQQAEAIFKALEDGVEVYRDQDDGEGDGDGDGEVLEGQRQDSGMRDGLVISVLGWDL